MSGTRFMVIKFKELIKTVIFAILGVAIIIGLIYLFVPKEKSSASLYEPGVYTSEVALNGEKVSVEVTVSKNKIKSVKMVNQSETVPVFYPLFETALETVGEEIVKEQSLAVNVPSDLSYTAQLIIDAVDESLQKAAAK